MFWKENNEMIHGKFISSSLAYFVGTVKKIGPHDVFPERSWNKYLGIVSATDNTKLQGCTKIDTTDGGAQTLSSLPEAFASVAIPGYDVKTGGMLSDAGLTSIPLKSTIILN